MRNLLASPATTNHCEIKNKSMTRRYFYLLLVCLMLCAFNLQSISAQTNTDNTIEKVKTSVSKRGTGEKSKVVVTMKQQLKTGKE